MLTDSHLKNIYKKNFIKHIPVDIDIDKNLSNDQIKYMFNTFLKYKVYKNLEDEQNFMTELDGFGYLNSTKCAEVFEKKLLIEKDLIEFDPYKNLLLSIYKLFHEEHNKREIEMLNNIYNYTKENQFNKAIFLIGSAHKNSIMKKINELEFKEVNWIFYND